MLVVSLSLRYSLIQRGEKAPMIFQLFCEAIILENVVGFLRVIHIVSAVIKRHLPELLVCVEVHAPLH